MTAREELATLIYRNQYPDPTSMVIEPLEKRAQWEQDMIWRGADVIIAAGYTKTDTFVKPEPKTIAERFAFERAWDAKVEAGRNAE